METAADNNLGGTEGLGYANDPAAASSRGKNRIIRLVFGRSLATQEHEQVKIGVTAAVPAMGLDALGSASYGPEAALTILLPLGAMGLAYLWPITLVIVALLTILYFSYRQTIAAYPVSGGSYTVATENLGVWPGLVAAVALMIDYLLNVAVGISAGVAALISAAPWLHRFTLPLCLGILLIITLLNLRGTGEAGLAFAVPTYLFIVTLLVAVSIGIFKTIAGRGHPHAVVPPPALHAPLEGVTLWLIMRAFASGCTAMTGVEAVSNGVSAFRPPTVQRAHRTLTVIVAVLTLLLIGISWLSRSYGIGAMDQDKPGYQSVISQMLGAVIGRNWLYFVSISSVLAVLCLSANSFVDFPRLCRLIAAHDFLPRGFAVVGRRLVYSVGVVVLAIFAGCLLIVFGGITDRLIPLFAVGAFLAFSLSQAGMVMHWRRELNGADDGRAKTAAWIRLCVNGVGAVSTGIALLIIVSAKFLEGAWICVVAIPVLLAIFRLIHGHYDRMTQQITAVTPLDLDHNQPPVVLVTTKGWDRPIEKALRFAFWISCDVIALHLSNLSGEEAGEVESRIRTAWQTNVQVPAQCHGVHPPRLDILPAPFRSIINPLMKELDRLEQEFPTRQIAVLTPRVVEKHWWNLLLHQRKSARLRTALLRRCDERIVLISMPWYINE